MAFYDSIPGYVIQIVLGILLVILVIVVYKWIMGRRRLKREMKVTNDETHKHDFNIVDSIVINNKPRIVRVCECGLAIHSPIYTKKQVQEIEGGRR